MRRLSLVLLLGFLVHAEPLIDRRAVVSRHAPTISLSSFPNNGAGLEHSVMTCGNGGFAFTADVTGLQSLNDTFRMPNAYPLETLSNWGMF